MGHNFIQIAELNFSQDFDCLDAEVFLKNNNNNSCVHLKYIYAAFQQQFLKWFKYTRPFYSDSSSTGVIPGNATCLKDIWLVLPFLMERFYVSLATLLLLFRFLLPPPSCERQSEI